MKRGKQTALFGPMKPVGLVNPHTGKRRTRSSVRIMRQVPLQSCRFQTHLKWGEQKRIISMIPGLENAEIVRYGVMHRNTFVNSPKLLEQTYQVKTRPNLYLAGQMTGVEGYVESAASGLIAGINAQERQGQEGIVFPQESTIGSMAYYITHADPDNFQPMNANFGLFRALRSAFATRRRKRSACKQSSRRSTRIY